MQGLGGGNSNEESLVITEDQQLRNTLSWILTENPRQFGLNVQDGEWIWVDELYALPSSYFVKSRKYVGGGREQYSPDEILECLKVQRRRYRVDCLEGRWRVRRVKDAKAEARAIIEQKRLATIQGEVAKSGEKAVEGLNFTGGKATAKNNFRPRMTHRVTANGDVKEPPKRTEEERRVRALKVHKAKRLLKNMGINPYKLGLDLEETEIDITFTPYEEYHREQYGNGMIKGKNDDYEATFEEI